MSNYSHYPDCFITNYQQVSSMSSQPVVNRVAETGENQFAPIPKFTPLRMMGWPQAGRKWLPNRISKHIFGAPLAPDKAEWDLVRQALWSGDKPMDDVVDWMFANGPRECKPLFDQALQQGIDTLNNPPQVLVDFFATYDRDPDWLDRNALEEGARASHLFSDVAYYVLRDQALMGGYAYFSSFNQTLGLTGALSKNTSKRIAETATWYNNVTESGQLHRFGKGFVTTMKVRLVHALVRRNVARKEDWDSELWGLPVNQIDMLATWLAFGPVTISGVRLFGVPVGKKDSKALLHLWRYIGWLLGLEDQWLIQSEQDGLRKLYHTFLTHQLPDEKVRQLGMALQQEPWERQLPESNLGPLREKLIRFYLYHQHLSNSSLILAPKQKRQLGIPFYVLPWYPVLTAPWRFLRLSVVNLRGEQARRAYGEKLRDDQARRLDAVFGEQKRHIINPQSGHPAHLG